MTENHKTHIFFIFRHVPVVFVARPMQEKSLNSPRTPRRRRAGTTSPPLCNVEPNPGPRKVGRKRSRSGASSPTKKRKTSEVSDVKRGQICMGLAHGMSNNAIANSIGRNHRTVDRIAKKMEKNITKENAPREGRPRVTTQAQDCALKIKSVRNRKQTAVSLAAEMKDLNTKINPSVWTVTVA